MTIRKSSDKANNRLTLQMSTNDQTNLYNEFKRLDFESVFDVLPLSKSNFIHLYNEKLTGKAAQVYDWALYYANYIAHYYRAGDDSNVEKKPLLLATNTTYAADQDQVTDLTLFNQVTYESLFPEDKGIPVCHPDSMKAQTSPIAYLVDLYQFVRSLGERKENEALAEPIKKLFGERRPDLESLCLNEKNATEAIPGLELVNGILSEAIRKNRAAEIPQDQTLDEFLAYSVYPFELPFHLPYVQVLKSLQEKKLSLATIIQQADKSYPYFLSLRLDDFNQTSTILKTYHYAAPTQIIAITQDWIPHPLNIKIRDNNFPFGAYLIEYYGLYHYNVVNDTIKALLAKLKRGETLSEAENKQLQDCEKPLIDELCLVQNFLKQTGLTRKELDQLFSSKQYAPKLSKNVINNLIDNDIKPATPAEYGSSYINSCGGSTLSVVADPPNEKIIGGDENHRVFQAINRFLRFQRDTGAKPNELDWLIKSLSAKEYIESAVHAFGFFHCLQARYTLSLEEFTALIYRLCPYSIGAEPSQFDRLFNANVQGTSSVLVLDGSKFDIQSANSSDQQTIQQLCTGLNIDRSTFQYIAMLWNGELTRSLKMVSWFYRTVRMARLFGFTVVEFVQLRSLVSEGQAINGSAEMDQPDRWLLLLIILEKITNWLKKHQLTLVQLLLSVEGINSSRLLVATPQTMNLFNTLKQIMDSEKIEKETQANTVLSQAVIKLYHVDPTLVANLLLWPGKNFAFSMLSELKKVKDKISDQNSLQKEGNEFLAKVTILERHMAAVKFLNLSNTELKLLNEHPEYFTEPPSVLKLSSKVENEKQSHVVYHESINKLQQVDPDLANHLAQLITKDFSTPILAKEAKQATDEPVPLTLKLFYLLTRLKDWLALSEESEEKLLSYFSFAHASPLDQASIDYCVQLVTESLHWDNNEIKFLFSQLSNHDKVAKTMSEIDWILRVKELCIQTGLSAEQVLKLSALNENPSYSDIVPLANALQRSLLNTYHPIQP